MTMFRSLLVGTAAGFVAVCTAQAAGLPVKAAPAPVAPVYNWTGFYIGGNIGYSWGRSSSTLSFSDAATGTVLSSTGTNFDLNGWIGGGQIGYNWQRNNWVFGLEADIQASGQKGDTAGSCAGGALTSVATLNGVCTPGHIGDTTPFNVAAIPVDGTLNQSLEWFGTVRGRIGPAITPTLIVYVTGGLAYGEVASTYSVSGTNIIGQQGTNTFTLVPVFASFSNSTTKTGWTAGAGIEGALGGNWTGRIEYLYVDLGTVSGVLGTPLVTTTGALLTSSFSSRITDNILRIAINYRWKAGGR
jgi:outer membrane immunogenic protein